MYKLFYDVIALSTKVPHIVTCGAAKQGWMLQRVTGGRTHTTPTPELEWSSTPHGRRLLNVREFGAVRQQAGNGECTVQHRRKPRAALEPQRSKADRASGAGR